jgi:hypothetical protein
MASVRAHGSARLNTTNRAPPSKGSALPSPSHDYTSRYSANHYSQTGRSRRPCQPVGVHDSSAHPTAQTIAPCESPTPPALLARGSGFFALSCCVPSRTVRKVAPGFARMSPSQSSPGPAAGGQPGGGRPGPPGHYHDWLAAAHHAPNFLVKRF